MGAKVTGPVVATLRAPYADAMRSSLASMHSALCPHQGLPSEVALVDFLSRTRSVPEGIERLFFCDASARLTTGTLDDFTVAVHPTERYLELVSAVAADREDLLLGFLHGWPILSCDSELGGAELRDAAA